MRNRKQNQGFTLIELLIVIAIIGILAAVLIPNLLAARNRANDTAAQAYLREAVTMQEINQVDTGTYAATLAILTSKGLKAAPAQVTLVPIAASTTGYCMSSVSAGGSAGAAANSKKTFYATAAGGISNTACTAAN